MYPETSLDETPLATETVTRRGDGRLFVVVEVFGAYTTLLDRRNVRFYIPPESALSA
jgi:hypothetical protein